MPLLSHVQFGSLEHLLPIGLAILLCFALVFVMKNKSELLKNQVFKMLGFFVSAFIAVFHLYKISQGDYSLQTDLPLFLCSFMALFIFVFTSTKSFRVFEILLFWIILGTSQGVITPDIEIGFPTFDYFRYWVVHLGVLIIIVYAIAVFKMKPTLKSAVKSFVVLQVYFVALMLINTILNANYGYLNYKPKAGSVLDYFGDWPTYVIIGQLILIPAFLIIYFPFFLFKRRIKNL